MTPLPLEFKDLLKSLNSKGVAYLLIGGWAVGHHGYVRYTGDIDFLIAATSDNADRLIATLMEFIGIAPPKKSIVELRKTLEFGNPPLRVHIMCDISGVEFDSCFARRATANWDGVPISIIGLDDLLKNKTASGRNKDLADVEFLKKYHKSIRRKKRS